LYRRRAIKAALAATRGVCRRPEGESPKRLYVVVRRCLAVYRNKTLEDDMKLKDLKKLLDKMTKEQLEQDLLVMAGERTLSGIGRAFKLNGTLYYNEEDDPSQLMTKAEMKENGYDVSEYEPYFKKGDLVIELD